MLSQAGRGGGKAKGGKDSLEEHVGYLGAAGQCTKSCVF